VRAQAGVRMLLFKAWKESRARFLFSAGTIALLCAGVVLFNQRLHDNPGEILRGFRAATYSEHVYDFVYAGTAKGLFVMLVLFIGQGGLLRERRRGTAPFTLGLPVSRTRLIGTQIVVGVLQVITIASLPLILVPGLSSLVGTSYPLGESLHFALLWLGGGLMIFGLAFVCSVLFSGEYTALVVAFLGLFAVPLFAQVRALQPYQLNFLMTMGEFGTMHWNTEHTLLLPAPIPWARLLVFLGIAVALLTLAVGVTHREDF
jgi:ABC-type transport system involved in multi-copper enzyme maturation permease subunit